MTVVPLEIVIVAIGLSMVAGVADVIRLPNWAWKKAEEPKVAYIALVGLLPIVGLGMYMVRARPKAKAVIAAGRAASLPFERFGDGAPPMDEEQVAEAPEPIQLVAVPATSLISAPLAPAVTQPKPEEEHKEEEPEAEPATATAGTFFSNQSNTATATADTHLAPPHQPHKPRLPPEAAGQPVRGPNQPGRACRLEGRPDRPPSVPLLEWRPLDGERGRRRRAGARRGLRLTSACDDPYPAWFERKGSSL